ncbi:hypothetical protein [Paraburkholderia rhizosphaerae]|uniref:Uncharacterized protein n=1 Tax=Paraburkholderia rhizosphaerae TaxID=480658 RepID=A0A4V3HE15_9BURK|nr:hypothetical protein [Paraburkholderia rhizosphaerae]TDY43325.1 hypothetical protein BX592_118120 [Paraburkholderia rhizosphaerae]
MNPNHPFCPQGPYLVGALLLICFSRTAAQNTPTRAPTDTPASAPVAGAGPASTGLYCDDPAHTGTRCCQLTPDARDKDDLCSLIPNINVPQNPIGTLIPSGPIDGIVVSPASDKFNPDNLAPGNLRMKQ